MGLILYRVTLYRWASLSGFCWLLFLLWLRSHTLGAKVQLCKVCVWVWNVCALFQNVELKKICSFRNLGNLLLRNTINPKWTLTHIWSLPCVPESQVYTSFLLHSLHFSLRDKLGVRGGVQGSLTPWLSTGYKVKITSKSTKQNFHLEFFCLHHQTSFCLGKHGKVMWILRSKNSYRRYNISPKWLNLPGRIPLPSLGTE